MAVKAGFDVSDLDDFQRQLTKMAERQFPTDTKKFLRGQGGKAKNLLKSKTRAATKKKTGNLIRGIDKGPVYKHGDEWSQRVYNKAPHAHLIERGHVLWVHGVNTERYVQGRYPAAMTTLQLRKTFPKDTEDFIDELIEKGLG